MKRANDRTSGTAHSDSESVRPVQSREWTGLSTVHHKTVRHQAGPGPENQEAQTSILPTLAPDPSLGLYLWPPGELFYHQAMEEPEGQSVVRQPLNFSGFPVEGDRSPRRNLVL